jgi:hypothetical protein
LFEEAQAKQDVINECTKIIEARDTALQRFIKQTGSLTVNPKEEQYNKTIRENFAKAEALQEEKVALIQKASSLVRNTVVFYLKPPTRLLLLCLLKAISEYITTLYYLITNRCAARSLRQAFGFQNKRFAE